MTTRVIVLVTLWLASSAAASFAQVAISATPGLLHYAEGRVFLDEEQVELTPARFATLRSGQRVRVGDGRAELLLSPRALLWMDKHSELEFLSDDLLNARVRLNQGSAVIQVMEYSGMEEAAPLSVVCGQTEVQLPGKGFYRLDCAPGLESLRLTVHRGVATVQRGQKTYEVRKNRSVLFRKVDNLEGIGSEPPIEPFLAAASDPFGEWSRQRSAELAKSRRRFAKRMRSMD